MVKVVSTANIFVAPVALSFLAFILSFGVFCCVLPLSRHQKRATAVHTCSTNYSYLFRVVFSPLSAVFRMFFFMGLIVCARIILRFLTIIDVPASSISFETLQVSLPIITPFIAYFFFIVGAVLSYTRNDFIPMRYIVEMILFFFSQCFIRQWGFTRIRMPFAIFEMNRLLAFLAVCLQSILFGFVLMKSGDGKMPKTSGALNGQGVHSVSLSLYLMMGLADGEIDRRFGSYPSQHAYFSTRQELKP